MATLIAVVGSYVDPNKKYNITLLGGRLRCSCPSQLKRTYCKHVLDIIEAVRNARHTGVFEWPHSYFEVTDDGRAFLNLSDNTGI